MNPRQFVHTIRLHVDTKPNRIKLFRATAHAHSTSVRASSVQTSKAAMNLVFAAHDVTGFAWLRCDSINFCQNGTMSPPKPNVQHECTAILQYTLARQQNVHLQLGLTPALSYHKVNINDENINGTFLKPSLRSSDAVQSALLPTWTAAFGGTLRHLYIYRTENSLRPLLLNKRFTPLCTTEITDCRVTGIYLRMNGNTVNHALRLKTTAKHRYAFELEIQSTG
jgi:hypothetical protein